MAFLILNDGTLFEGVSVGATTHAFGEVVFNTAQTGYQEILTDPSYFGQIITFTSPHIGNVGVNNEDCESVKVHASGMILREFSNTFSNWRAQGSLQDFLKHQKIVALSEIDTRALTLYLREKGSQTACISATDTLSPEMAFSFLKEYSSSTESARQVSTQKTYEFAAPEHYKAHIVVVDCGAKTSILRSLAHYPVKITVVPYDITYDELLAYHPNGVLLSNGPGDPQSCLPVIHLANTLLQHKVPLFGICLGHQIMALAAGAKTRKMKFGHHGANHPIQCHQSGKVFISSQNHGFVVDEASLPSWVTITHTSLFDGTIAGLAYRHAPAFSFQGHPEANPGPNELLVLFEQFINQVQHGKKYAN